MSLGKPPRLRPLFQKYEAPLFFVTICTRNRKKLLANEAVHCALVEYGQRGIERGVALGRYVIMPNHIHLFVGDDHNFDLGMWVRGLKRVVAAAVLSGRADGGWLAQGICRRGRTAATTANAKTQSSDAAPSIWQNGF